MKRLTIAVFVALLVVTTGCTGITESNTTAAPPTDNTTTDSNTTSSITETTSSPSGLKNATGTVTKIIDGNTYVFEHADGTRENITLLGVETPSDNESEVDVANFGYSPGENDYEKKNNRAWLADAGHMAIRYAQIELRHEEITISTDSTAPGATDADGNRLVYITTDDGDDFARILLWKGYGQVTDHQHSRASEYKTLQDKSKKANNGMWEHDEDSEDVGA